MERKSGAGTEKKKKKLPVTTDSTHTHTRFGGVKEAVKERRQTENTHKKTTTSALDGTQVQVMINNTTCSACVSSQ